MIHLYPIGFSQTTTADVITKILEDFLGKGKILLFPQAIDRAAFAEQYLKSLHESTAVLLLIGPQAGFWNPGVMEKDWGSRVRNAPKKEEFFVAVEEKGQILAEAQLENFLGNETDFAIDYIIRQDTRERDIFMIYNALNACFPNPSSADERVQLAIDEGRTFLDLSRCQLQQLPSNFIKLAPNLERLNLEGNGLGYIPTELSLCEQLEVLDLRNNPLGRGTGLARLKNLKVLNLRNTQLHDFPNEVIECFQLEQLDLSKNYLSHISGGIGSLQRLQRLNLVGNKLLELPEQLAEMPSLQDIILISNPLRTPPTEVAMRGMASIQAFFDDLTYDQEGKKGQNWFFAAVVETYVDPAQKNRADAIQDCQALAQVLQDKYAYDPTFLLFNAQVTEQQVLTALQTLDRRCGPRDNLIFYFSVNTEQAASQESYLRLYDRSLPFSQITGFLNAFQAKHILVIIDEYFYTPLLESSRSSKGRADTYSSRWVLYNQQLGADTRFCKFLIQFLQTNKQEISVNEIAYQLPNIAANPISLRGDEGGNFPFFPVKETADVKVTSNDWPNLEVNQVRDQIANGQMEQALTSLINTINEPWKDDFLLMESRWRRLQKQEMQGIIDSQGARLEQNRISYNLISLLEKLGPDAFTHSEIKGVSPVQEPISDTTLQVKELIERIEELRRQIAQSTSTRERRNLQIELNAALLTLENYQDVVNTDSSSQTSLTLELLAEANDWTSSLENNSISEFQAFLERHPNSIYAKEAVQKISELSRQNQEEAIVEDLRQHPSPDKFISYSKDFPKGKLRFQVQALKTELEKQEAEAWKKALNENSVEAFEHYLKESKLHYHDSEVNTRVQQLRDEKGTLVNEAKLIIVGNGRVGKTSLTKVLVGEEPFDPQESSTHGIRIKTWTIPTANGQTLTLNIWDFGGQERYHNTHSFFLTKRALYLLVWDKTSQEDAQKNPNLPDPEAQNFDYIYWLNTIKTKGGNSPLLMVQNKIEIDRKQNFFDEAIEQFDNIVDTEAVSAATGENLDELRKNILKQYQNAERLKTLIPFTMPNNWREVREILAKRGDSDAYISIEEYYEICEKKKITDADALAHYLNDIGSVLYFPDGDRLSEILILNPTWATEVVYKILNGLVKANGGYFKYEDLKNTSQKTDSSGYNSTGFSFKDDVEKKIFLELMLRFEICFEIKKAGDSITNRKDATYLVPQYLSAEKPDTALPWPLKGGRKSGYHYTFLPRSVIARVIARLGKMAQEGNWWRDGLIIEDQGTHAKIEADYAHNCILIEVHGKEMKELEARLQKEHFNEINLQMQATQVRFCPHCNSWIEEKRVLDRLDQNDNRLDCPSCGKAINIPSLYPTVMETKPRIFISYDQKDAIFREQLDISLRQLKWEGELDIWDDSQVQLGDQWDTTVKRELAHANIIVFLMSKDFLTSKVIKQEEIQLALERYASSEVLIIPVIAHPCLWESTPLAKFFVLPADHKPVSNYDNQEDAWFQITTKIRETLIQRFNWGKKD